MTQIANENSWSSTWLNDAVTFHLSPLAQPDRDLLAFGTFPRLSAEVGLVVFIPNARYMLALKLKSLQISDFQKQKGVSDMPDIAHLLKVLEVTDVETAISILADFFPRSAADADKQRFILKRLVAGDVATDAPEYPRTDR